MLALAVSVTSVRADNLVRESVTYYDISGSTAQALREALNVSGPVGTDGKRYDGHTKWDIRWRFNFHTPKDVCEVSNIETTVEVTTTLPRWSDWPHASPHLVEQWEDYTRALTTHERGHMNIAIRTAETIRSRVKDLRDSPSCSELQLAIDRATNAVLNEAREEEIQYDKMTGHGETEGARFP